MSICTTVAGKQSGYEIQNAGGFNGAAHLNRTWSGSPTNAQIYTYSFWIKKLGQAFFQNLMMAGVTGDNSFIAFNTDDTIRFSHSVGSVQIVDYITNAVYRDPSSWYHIVWTVNATLATEHNRLYVNGVEITSWAVKTQPAGTFTPVINSASQVHYISRNSASAIQQLNGYMADINFIDGQVVLPSEFGEVDNQTGAWVPKRYAGTYGNDGFLLEFQDSGNQGLDTSGNGNTFTNTSVNQREDTPTDNHAVLNVHNKGSGLTTTNAGLVTTRNTASAWRTHMTTVGMDSGKWYWETELLAFPSTDSFMFGLVLEGFIGETHSGVTTLGYGFWFEPTTPELRILHNGVDVGSVPAPVLLVNDVVMMAYDADVGSVWIGVNGTWLNSGDPTAGTGFVFTGIFVGNPSYRIPAISLFDNTTSVVWQAEPLVIDHSVPTGFSLLSTANLPEPIISKTTDYFETLLWTGDGVSPRDISGLEFQPDLVIMKSRTLVSPGSNHVVADFQRGGNASIFTNLTNAEQAGTNGHVSAFNSDGFEVSVGATDNRNANQSGEDYVGWCWREGVTPGFDIVLYSGNGVFRTLSHNLGVIPEVMLVKNRDSVTSWLVYHGYGVSDPETDYYVLNENFAFTDSAVAWDDTAPNATFFTVGNGTAVNQDTANHVAYLFASVPGFSKMGSYVGNGSTNGPFVYTGFRPKYLLIKNRSGANSWIVLDSARNVDILGGNPMDRFLLPDLEQIESTSTALSIDFYSNGFKLRQTGGATNANGNIYIYMAFAEHPFNYANAF